LRLVFFDTAVEVVATRPDGRRLLFVVATAVAAVEELEFRGYPLQELRASYGTWSLSS
jgi:membrane protease YdiL (CAAX protease family)